MIQVCKKMIRSVFIIHQGKCLVTIDYQTTDISNVDLFGGFLSVADNFAKTMLNESLSELHLEHTKITYKSENDLVVAILADLRSQVKLDEVLDQLYYTFYHKYSDYLKQPVVSTSVFQPFKKSIDEILQYYFVNYSATSHKKML